MIFRSFRCFYPVILVVLSGNIFFFQQKIFDADILDTLLVLPGLYIVFHDNNLAERIRYPYQRGNLLLLLNRIVEEDIFHAVRFFRPTILIWVTDAAFPAQICAESYERITEKRHRRRAPPSRKRRLHGNQKGTLSGSRPDPPKLSRRSMLFMSASLISKSKTLMFS